ncbi:acyltransferase family protein [Micromonospora eburnea]|uniref:acyltransferase family protein n=1 Tax=Micromonospora eburnea TaxID=227316 RepID=UPI001FC8FCCA|nr:acyltransferase family protein [Micromonospora eburnea]
MSARSEPGLRAPQPPPAGRDRVIDALRAYAIGGVVLGHWLVTALVLTADGTLRTASPLTALPALAPATWLLQTLGLFFFTAGYAATRSLAGYPHGAGRWLARRLGRLLRPALALLGVGSGLLLAAIVLGTPDDTLAVAVTLAVSPLWFLLPLVALSVLTGPLLAAVRRWGPLRCAAPAVAVVAAADLAARMLPAAPGRLPVALLAAWAVPWLLGVAHADGRLTGSRPAAGLAAAGGGALVALVALGYPASAVGVPGAGMSNLYPPSLFAVALAACQIGLALLARPALARVLYRARPARPGPVALVATVNREAIGIYLWHQPVLVAVTALTARLGRPLPGLHTAPAGLGWVAARLCWLPLFALVLAALLAPRRGPSGRHPGPVVPGPPSEGAAVDRAQAPARPPGSAGDGPTATPR